MYLHIYILKCMHACMYLHAFINRESHELDSTNSTYFAFRIMRVSWMQSRSILHTFINSIYVILINVFISLLLLHVVQSHNLCWLSFIFTTCHEHDPDVVFPKHQPKVIDCLRHWTLGSNVKLVTKSALKIST